MKAFVDLRPLRENRTFRRLWVGTTASGFGSQFGQYATLFYVWQRSHNAAVVGLVGLATALPLIVLALAGSAFADHVDRRQLAIRGTWLQLLVSIGMTVVAFTDLGGVPAMLALVAITSGCSALIVPARAAFVPLLLGGDRLAAGLALNHSSFQLAMLLGLAAAGALTAMAGLPWCFVIDTVTFAAALIGLAGLPAGIGPASGTPGWSAVKAGLRYAATTPALRGALLADLVATVFAMPTALFPVLNAERFGGRPEILGLFTTAIAVGGVTASVLSGLATRQRHPGLVLLAGGAVWGAGLGLVGLTPHLWTVLLLLAVVGAADTWAVVSRGTVVQGATLDSYRGRVSSLEYVAGVAGPQLGNLRAGLVAASSSAGLSLALGGATALLATGLIAISTPALRRFRLPVRAPASSSAPGLASPSAAASDSS